MSTFLYRLMGATMLDAGMYETIEADRTATRQAFLVVIGASFAAGIGASGFGGPTRMTLLLAAASALVAWLAWAVLIQRIGGLHLPERGTRVTLGELLRTLGFAAAPGWLQAFAIFPEVTIPVYVISWAWMLAAMVVAVKHALDYRSTVRAIVVCGCALGLVAAFAALLSALFGPTATA